MACRGGGPLRRWGRTSQFFGMPLRPGQPASDSWSNTADANPAPSPWKIHTVRPMSVVASRPGFAAVPPATRPGPDLTANCLPISTPLRTSEVEEGSGLVAITQDRTQRGREGGYDGWRQVPPRACSECRAECPSNGDCGQRDLPRYWRRVRKYGFSFSDS